MNDTKTVEELCGELQSAAAQLAALQRILTECAKAVLRENYTREMVVSPAEQADHDDMVRRATVGKIY